jgi:hypothetical protein
VEAKRLDDLVAYSAILLATIAGEDLDRVLAGTIKRYGRSDAAYRQAALDGTHPDDLAQALATAGLPVVVEKE